jgi:hypothetical protein
MIRMREAPQATRREGPRRAAKAKRKTLSAQSAPVLPGRPIAGQSRRKPSTKTCLFLHPRHYGLDRTPLHQAKPTRSNVVQQLLDRRFGRENNGAAPARCAPPPPCAPGRTAEPSNLNMNCAKPPVPSRSGSSRPERLDSGVEGGGRSCQVASPRSEQGSLRGQSPYAPRTPSISLCTR